MIVVSDTSPIRALTHLGRLDLLRRFYDEVVVPPLVRDELEFPARRKMPAVRLDALQGVRVAAPAGIHPQLRSLPDLHQPEVQALSLAVELSAGAILLDDLPARRAAATLGLRPMGTLGVLIRAKEQGLLPALRPEIVRLRGDLGFFLSDGIVARALARVGETP